MMFAGLVMGAAGVSTKMAFDSVLRVIILPQKLDISNARREGAVH